ncbi:hypothetical protein H5410_019019 [Solanum commersonii]|uniref:Uncharacterized protein n=1 Tax=Solanum commersonii TaxID=4109 RepID=A0A9J6A4H0_SOLCO|nr:hypothetical protein H5410_019019 [Solanum commersonii]
MNEVSKGTLAEKVGEETKKTMAEIVMNKMKGQCEGRDNEGGDKVDINFSSVKNTMVEKMEWETNEKTADVDSNNSIERSSSTTSAGLFVSTFAPSSLISSSTFSVTMPFANEKSISTSAPFSLSFPPLCPPPMRNRYPPPPSIGSWYPLVSPPLSFIPPPSQPWFSLPPLPSS